MASDYINALLKKEVTRTPIWVMRQAGRYLPEYRETRKKAGDFITQIGVRVTSFFKSAFM